MLKKDKIVDTIKLLEWPQCYSRYLSHHFFFLFLPIFYLWKLKTFLQICEGKFINGDIMIVDGGLWLSRPRHLAKEAVKQVSRSVEKRSRNVPVGVPKSKL